MPRARLLAALLLQGGRPYTYGSHSCQRAELHLPDGPGPHPVIVLIHGGSWQRGYGKVVMRALAGDLRRRGWACWNIEYRRVGNGGGWPQTFADVAAAIDYLRRVDAPLDTGAVGLVGHSAGGHLALWAAGRSKLPPGAPGAPAGRAPVTVREVVAMAGVCDLAGAYRLWHGGAVRALMGGSPARLPERFAAADPMRLVPLEVPALLVHGELDETVPVSLSRSYARAAEAAGGEVELVELEGRAGQHRAHIDPRGAAWQAVTHWLQERRSAAREPAARR
jgi:acetyl esterase/lipase